MANFIPKIEYIELNTLTPKSITFDSPPEGDPIGESYKHSSTVTSSNNGQRQTAHNYVRKIYDIDFIFQSKEIKEAMVDFVNNHAARGGKFNYFIHSDEVEYEEMELEGKGFKLSRPIPAIIPSTGDIVTPAETAEYNDTPAGAGGIVNILADNEGAAGNLINFTGEASGGFTREPLTGELYSDSVYMVQHRDSNQQITVIWNSVAKWVGTTAFNLGDFPVLHGDGWTYHLGTFQVQHGGDFNKYAIYRTLGTPSKDVDELVLDWNTSNPINTASVISGGSEIVDDAFNFALTGGVDEVLTPDTKDFEYDFSIKMSRVI